MALLDPSHFEQLYSPFRGKRVGFVPMDGHAGDYLIHEATELLFEHFGIEYVTLTNEELNSAVSRCDEIVVSGGGNMGGPFYELPFEQRQRALGTGLPVTVFPQSFIEDNEDLSPYKQVFVREGRSHEMHPEASLAPDPALGYLGWLDYSPPEAGTGVFLRDDREQRFAGHPSSLGDSAELCYTVGELFDLASRFEHIVTDRLHFGVAALLLGRRVTLLPNSYFKNRSYYETWLSEICEWCDDPSTLEIPVESFTAGLLRRLVGSPTDVTDCGLTPVQEEGFFLEQADGRARLVHADGVRAVECDASGAMIWQLSTGAHTISDITKTLADAFPESQVAVARDVARTLERLVAFGALSVDSAPRIFLTATNLVLEGERLEVVVGEPKECDGRLRFWASVEGGEIWFDVDHALRDRVSPNADPFALTALMGAMQSGVDLTVAGAPVTAGLLRNLEQFQAAWSAWRRGLTAVDVEAEEARLESASREGVLLAFSGGVDSCYTAYRHLIEPDVRRSRPIGAGLFIGGFDIAFDDDERYDRAFENAGGLLSSTGVELLGVRTNARDFLPDWLDGHGLVLAACLSLFGGRYEGGVISATLPYSILQPLGSNAVTDPMLGSDDFSILHHGAAVSRLDKVRVIASWPAVRDGLRVCWAEAGGSTQLNCGECLSCVLTAMMFHCLGAQPPCLPAEIGADQAARVLDRDLGRLEWYDVQSIRAEARARELDFPWLDALTDAAASSKPILVD